MAHLDIRLANVCLRKRNTEFEAVLIDLERCKQIITTRLKDEVFNSCMYTRTSVLDGVLDLTQSCCC